MIDQTTIFLTQRRIELRIPITGQPYRPNGLSIIEISSKRSEIVLPYPTKCPTFTPIILNTSVAYVVIEAWSRSRGVQGEPW